MNEGCWYALLQGPTSDQAIFKGGFAHSSFEFTFIDEHFAFSAPDFADLENYEEVIQEVTSLLASINVSLRISNAAYMGFDLHALARKRGDGLDRIMLASPGHYGITGVAAVAMAGSLAQHIPRSKEERLTSLMNRLIEVEHIARDLSIRPVTWSALNTAYETIKGMTSTKVNPEDARADYKALIDKGWISDTESGDFYHTAAYHRHGFPKSRMRTQKAMTLDAATVLIQRLLWRFVDENEPK